MSTSVGDLLSKLKIAWEADPHLGSVPVYRDSEPSPAPRAFPYIVVKIRVGGALRRTTNLAWYRQPTIEFIVRHRTPELVEQYLGYMRSLLDNTLPTLDAGKGSILSVRCTSESHGQDADQVHWGRLDYEYWRREPRTRA